MLFVAIYPSRYKSALCRLIACPEGIPRRQAMFVAVNKIIRAQSGLAGTFIAFGKQVFDILIRNRSLIKFMFRGFNLLLIFGIISQSSIHSPQTATPSKLRTNVFFLYLLFCCD